MKRNSVFGKMVVLGIIGAFAALALATPALAQKAKEMDAVAKMMSDGWKQFNDGQSMIHQGRGDEQPGGCAGRLPGPDGAGE